jgi:hypothetical protein
MTDDVALYAEAVQEQARWDHVVLSRHQMRLCVEGCPNFRFPKNDPDMGLVDQAAGRESAAASGENPDGRPWGYEELKGMQTSRKIHSFLRPHLDAMEEAIPSFVKTRLHERIERKHAAKFEEVGRPVRKRRRANASLRHAHRRGAPKVHAVVRDTSPALANATPPQLSLTHPPLSPQLPSVLVAHGCSLSATAVCKPITDGDGSIRCCKDAQPGMSVCSPVHTTQASAASACATRGYRLCTLAELAAASEQNGACSTGCGFNSGRYILWSGDACTHVNDHRLRE